MTFTTTIVKAIHLGIDMWLDVVMVATICFDVLEETPSGARTTKYMHT